VDEDRGLAQVRRPLGDGGGGGVVREIGGHRGHPPGAGQRLRRGSGVPQPPRVAAEQEKIRPRRGER